MAAIISADTRSMMMYRRWMQRPSRHAADYSRNVQLDLSIAARTPGTSAESSGV